MKRPPAEPLLDKDKGAMETHKEVLSRLGVDAVSQALGEKYNTVAKWKQRDSVPPEKWIALLALTKYKFRLTAHDLAVMAAKR